MSTPLSFTMEDVLLDLEIEQEHETPCEGANHPTGLHGHDPSEPASWMLILKCGHEWLCCAAWLQHAEEAGANHPLGWFHPCARCGLETFGHEMVRIKIRD